MFIRGTWADDKLNGINYTDTIPVHACFFSINNQHIEMLAHAAIIYLFFYLDMVSIRVQEFSLNSDFAEDGLIFVNAIEKGISAEIF